MKTDLFRQFIVIALSSTIGFLAFATPVLANSPVIAEETWEGHVWNPDPFDLKTFQAPAGATSVEIVGQWGWTGSPNQNQRNEQHEFQLPNGQVIQCDDYGNEELAGQWLLCGSTTFEWTNDLEVKVKFTGDKSSPGSHAFRITVRWHGDSTISPPSGQASCQGGSVTNPNPFPIQVTYRVDGQVVFTGEVPADAPQPIGYTYIDAFGHNAEFIWSGNGQTGQVNLGDFGPCINPGIIGAISCTVTTLSV